MGTSWCTLKYFQRLGDEFSNGNIGSKVEGKRMWGHVFKIHALVVCPILGWGLGWSDKLTNISCISRLHKLNNISGLWKWS